MSLHTRGRRALGAAVAMIAGVGVLVLPQPAAAHSAPSLTESVRGTMLAQHGEAARRGFETSTLAAPLVEPTRYAGTWAFGSTTAHVSPPSSIFVARHDRGGWRVELDGSAGFVDLARQAPPEVVSADENRLFAQNHQASQSIMADTVLGLPWPQNVAWWMGGGPHGNSGQSRPFSSIDFNGGDGRVLSVGPGKVYKSCVVGRSALVKVLHPNGFSTTYYHMYNLTTLADGSNVATGTYLGHIGNELPCGGSSSGAHVHFSLLRGSTHISVNARRSAAGPSSRARRPTAATPSATAFGSTSAAGSPTSAAAPPRRCRPAR